MLTLIAAVDRHEHLGSSTGVPWYSPADLRFFREETMGGTLLTTHENLAGFNPDTCFEGRQVIIVDPQKRPRPAGTLSFETTDQALKYCWEHIKSRIYVIGGANLYEELLPKAWRVLLSRAKQKLDDSFIPAFPEMKSEEWNAVDHWLLDCGVVPMVSEYIRRMD